ncbi:MAG: hypothetical protein NTV34_00935, partial [Proteobacteria bacterium]|nr:hypothetical protein [Pseudomonadota bacterium]
MNHQKFKNGSPRIRPLKNFMKLKDKRSSWILIYETLGESALREYSKQLYNPREDFGRNIDDRFYSRLWYVLEQVHLTQNLFWYYAINLPLDYKLALCRNKSISIDVLEYLLSFTYLDHLGNPDPQKGAFRAFMKCRKQFKELYIRKPWIRRLCKADLK